MGKYKGIIRLTIVGDEKEAPRSYEFWKRLRDMGYQTVSWKWSVENGIEIQHVRMIAPSRRDCK